MARLIMMVGNIGMGKSLIAKKKGKEGAVVVNMDSTVSMIAGGEYGLYDPNKADIYRAIEDVSIVRALKNNFDVILDRTNMSRKKRERYLKIGKYYSNHIICYDFGPGQYEECIKRRMKDPKGIPEKVWEHVFCKLEEEYEEPSIEEGFYSIIKMPDKYTVHSFDFDGTIVEKNWPDIGEIKLDTVDKMRELWEDHRNLIVIWTCRSGDLLNKMRKFLLENKIPFDAINENPVFETGSRKLYADVYYDDRNKII